MGWQLPGFNRGHQLHALYCGPVLDGVHRHNLVHLHLVRLRFVLSSRF
jgi:hypothetical protein